MILEKLGRLDPATHGTPHALTAGTEVSENVIDLTALAAKGFGPGGNQAFLDIEVVVAETGADTDTYVFNLVLDDSSNLASVVYKVLSIEMVGSDPRLKTVGGKVYSGEIPDQVWQLSRLGYRYLGMQYILANVGGTAAVSVIASISPSRPRTPDNVQVTYSPVNLPS